MRKLILFFLIIFLISFGIAYFIWPGQKKEVVQEIKPYEKYPQQFTQLFSFSKRELERAIGEPLGNCYGDYNLEAAKTGCILLVDDSVVYLVYRRDSEFSKYVTFSGLDSVTSGKILEGTEIPRNFNVVDYDPSIYNSASFISKLNQEDLRVSLDNRLRAFVREKSSNCQGFPCKRSVYRENWNVFLKYKGIDYLVEGADTSLIDIETEYTRFPSLLSVYSKDNILYLLYSLPEYYEEGEVRIDQKFYFGKIDINSLAK